MREERPSVAVAIDEWLSDLELSGKPASTRRTYTSLLRPLRSDASIMDFGPPDCRAFVGERVRKRSLATAATCYGALSSFCKWAVARGYFALSPMAGIPCPHPKLPDQRVFTDAELARLWAAADTDEVRLILLLLETGMRVGELVAVRWQDVQPDGTLRLIFTKGGKPRIVLASPPLLALLATQKPRPRLVPLTTQNVRDRLRRLGRRAGVPDCRPHRFRALWAIRWLEATDNDTTALKALGGWHGNQMVERYTRSAQQRLAVAKARRVGLSLFGHE